MPYVATLQSTGSSFTLTRRYDGDIPGWGGMRVHDEIYLGDFAGTGRSDLLIWNSRDWSSNYLALFRQLQGGFQCIRFYEDDLPGWGGFARNDRFYVGDFSGDGKDDLFIFNGPDWANPYLGMFRSTGSDFSQSSSTTATSPGGAGWPSTINSCRPISPAAAGSACLPGTWRTGARTTPAGWSRAAPR